MGKLTLFIALFLLIAIGCNPGVGNSPDTTQDSTAVQADTIVIDTLDGDSLLLND